MIIKKNELERLLAPVMKRHEFYAPSGSSFRLVKNFKEIALDKKMAFPAKQLFFPQREELFSFSGNSMKAGINKKHFVLFGVRPCDMNAIAYMDHFFRHDPYYNSTDKIIFGVQCNRGFQNCYCHLTDSFHSVNYDILLIEGKDDYFLDIKTEKGRRLLDHFKSKKTASEADINSLIDMIKKDFAAKKAELEVNDKKITQLAKKCFNCAACTAVCPTCTCFSIADELKSPSSGVRAREWDFCHKRSFTRVAGDFVFRSGIEDRLANNIKCKFLYSKERYGKYSCVGCGRCVEACPANINIFEALSE